MTDSPKSFARLKCLFLGHKWAFDRAEDREEDGYQQLYPNDNRDPEPIPACYIVDKCQRCGDEQRIYSSVNTAESFNIPLEWEENHNE